ncbi:MAG: PadR family transcriptional regulator [Candidatus Lokiarchaeota archaeon]|nr:PadR family transcriptional regulator [Candidatus Lokiarchaeota archaeon]
MISNKELVILCMLYKKSMYGYEIEKEIIDTSMRDWTEIAFSSIYYLLKKLESKDFVVSEISLNKKSQTRKIYTITSKGKEIVKSNLLKIISERENLIWRIDLGLAYLDILNSEEILKGLENYRKDTINSIKGYNNLLDYLKSNNCSYNRLELAERPLILLEAENKWINNLISKIKESN